ncbi:MAG TPA: methylenetetrahydrofolate reductase [Acidimicrobiales bacterium]|nr:methylenetetrahydrofolate reductase [Acidimicrobiales bacterium]
MAKVSDLLAQGRTYSFEFFPPKNDAEQGRLVQTLLELQPLRPSFVSVTYRGGRSSRKRTTDVVVSMLRLTNLNPMAHLICAGHTRLELADILVEFRKLGIENLMALGGDPPEGPAEEPGELEHALQLVELARAIGGFCIGVAAHPAGHPRSPSLPADRRHLARKLRRADFAVTQFFFEPSDYFRLVDDLGALGLTKPVLPGILPVVNLASVPRMALMGCAVPPWLSERLETAQSRGGCEDVAKVGVEAATQLCATLLEKGAPGLHFYTLNRSEATRQIHSDLGLHDNPRRSEAILTASGLSSTSK